MNKQVIEILYHHQMIKIKKAKMIIDINIVRIKLPIVIILYQKEKCAEQTSAALFLFKKKTRKLVFIEEKFLYILKDIIINKNDNRLRRVIKKYDISKLCNIEAKADKTNKFIFKLQFLKNDYFDRETRTFIFDEQRGTIFYELIAETLEKVESTFFNDLSDDDEEEEEEEDKDDKGDGLEISGNEIDLSAKSMNKIGFDDKNNDLISTSRKKII